MKYQYQYSNKIGLPWVLKNIPHLVFPNLEKKKDRFKILFNGVIATLDKKPIALILSTKADDTKSARIHSFFVHPDHRQTGIGGELLTKLEKALAQEGVLSINGYYRTHWKGVKILEKLLIKKKWEEPFEDLILVKGETHKVLSLFTANDIKLPDNTEIVPWTELSQAQKKNIKIRKEKENWYLDYLDPFIFEETIYSPASLTLIKNNEVIGWVISHLVSKETNEFTGLFIDGSQRQFKLAHLLMREAINRQHKDGVINFLITSKSNNYVMSRFLIRHAPHTDVFFTKSFKAVKKLT